MPSIRPVKMNPAFFNRTQSADAGLRRMKPLAHAIALMLATGSMLGDATAQQAFSAAWYAQKGAVQATAAATGKLPNGMPAVPTSTPLMQQQQASEQLQRSLANLNSAARAIAIQQAQQSAARLAAGGSVPDGLGVGGLDVGSLVSSWINAQGPTQSTSNGKTIVDIKQTADKAILNWETFNIGKNTILQFDQQADWSVLNRINNATAPSVIQGQIKAPGTVMIVNANGIIFSGSSQVNTRNLVVAAAHILDSQFNTGIYSPNASTASFTGANGNVLIEAGAQIATHEPTSVTAGGGYVLVMGKEVTNAGEIVTRKGQTTLAAGDSFFIRKGVGTEGNTYSTTRGNEVVSKIDAGSTAGKVTNSGLIMAREGDVTLTGRDVQQNGVAVATTTVNTRGTIHLLNSASDTQGTVTLGQGSTTAILIEDDGKSTALDSQRDALIKESAAQDLLRVTTNGFDNLSTLADRRDQSRIEIVSGGDVHFATDSLTLATGGQVAVSAKDRTFVADKANIDVSGAVGVNVAMESNNVKVNIQGNELRDSPDNRDAGKLLNNDIWLDRRDLILVPAGTGGYASDRWYAAGGLLEVSGYLSNQGHSIGEWAAQGGTVTLGGSEVITQQGSAINLSGGSYNVQTGMVNQTWLKGSDGRLYRIGEAPAGVTYTGVYKGFEDKSERWGENNTKYYYNPLIAARQRLENGYTVGRDAGQLIVSAPTAVLEGELVTKVYQGEQQTRVRDAVGDGYKQAQTAAAKGATIALGQYGAPGRVSLYDSDVKLGDVAEVTLGMAASDALDPTRVNTVWIDSQYLNDQHLSGLDLGTRGNITIDKAITLNDGGTLKLMAAHVDIAADVTVRGGSISTSNIFSAAAVGFPSGPLIQNGSSSVTVRNGVTLDVSGRWVNTVLAPESSNGLAYLNGGSVKLESTGDVNIAAGSLIDASSGAAILAKGKQQGGKGGNVTLVADAVGLPTAAHGVLTLDGEIRGYGVSGGGTLKLETGNAVVIGATNPNVADLNLDSRYLQSGFAKYDINGHAGMTVADGTQLNILMPQYRIAANALSNVDGANAFEIWTSDLYLDDQAKRQMVQRSGADLILRSQRQTHEGGDIVIGSGAVISVDPGRTISLQGGGKSNIIVNGRLNAWGGNVAIGIDGPANSSGLNTSQQAHNRSIWIGESAVLDVAARAATSVTSDGRRYGSVANGGTISLGGSHDWESKGDAVAPDIAIVIRPGALLDASGSSATLDIPRNGSTTAVNVASNGGEIVLKSTHSMYIDGTLRAKAGGAGAAGGTLAIALETPSFATNYQPVDAVRAQREMILSQFYQDSGLSAGMQPGQADPAFAYGKGRISAEQINGGGFDNLSLLVNGILSFDGSVDLKTAQSMRIYAGSFSLADGAANDAQIKLASSYVRLAGTTRAPKDEIMFGVTRRNSAGTTSSDATFSVEADLVEIRDRVGFGAHGDITMQNGSKQTVDRRAFGEVEILSRGDLRLLGGTAGRGLTGDVTTELASMGNITITAAQIYPATNVSAQIVAGYDDRPWPDGKYFAGSTLEIKRYGDALAAAPLSVFGSLRLGADIVLQGGVVRAPMGNLVLGQDGRSTSTAHASVLELLAGSVTSVSGAGVVMPYGGTVDGIAYDYAGKPITPRALGSSGIALTANSVIGHDGSVLDLSGGGELTGAGFVSGRGGSVDIIRTPLVNANPAFNFSKAGNAVYAIVPSFGGAYAPVSPDAGYGDPMIGKQLTFDSDVAGLKAGTYTLMPSTYALLPGAFRIELGASALPGGVAAAGNGSYVAAAYVGVANTSVLASLPNQVIVTPAASVRKHSAYNETGYDAFVLADAARRGGMRGAISADAGNLTLDYDYSKPQAGLPMLQFDGTALFNPAAGSYGYGGTLAVISRQIEVLADGTAPTAAFVGASLHASDLNAFGAARIILGGSINMSYGDNFATFKSNGSDIVVRSDAHLKAAEVFLVSGTPSGSIVVEQGASINTIGQGKAAYDSSNGIVFSTGTTSVLGVSNGWINLLPSQAGGAGGGTINVGKCNAGPCSGETNLYGEGTLAIATDKSFTLEDNTRYGAKNLLLAVSALNLGSDAALNQAGLNGALPSGLSMNQGVLDRLLSGNAGVGAPAVESLIINARESVNIYGSVALDTFNPTTGKSSIERLVLGTPAIYGYGAAGDKATITTGEFIWTGAAITPTSTTGEYLPNTPGAAIGNLLGDSTLDINAQRILFGYGPNTQPNSGLSADRLALGFGSINLNASERVTSNGKGTLNVYHRQGNYVAGSGYQYSGGDLNINAPLLTGEAASSNRITVGGALTVKAPAGTTVGSSDALGAELQLSGRTVYVDTAVVLPSGKLTLTATEDLVLGDNAQIDLSGRAVKFFEQTRYSWGGDLSLTSKEGNITQSAGSIIDLSAERNRAGTLKAVALDANAGHIDLAGSILGSSSGQYDAGGTLVPFDGAEITLHAQTLGDFAALNARLNEGEVFGARRFQIKQGDLTIGDEVKARKVEVVVDGGSLTVDGRIDASGVQVGSIYLAAKDDLTINGTLDAHGTGLRVDSYGQIIDSPNRAIVDLTTKEGMLTLASTAHIDLRAGTNVTHGNDGVARGTLNLNAPRLGGVGGSGNGANDVAVTVNGTPLVAGAKTIAVNAFRTYDDAPTIATPDVNGHKPQEITQEYFDGIRDGNGVIVRGGIDPHNTEFIDAALGNTDLSNRLSGLGNYHLRPGVEIVGTVSADNPNGDLIISGDLDLSGYRYGPNANRTDPALRGYGEPGVLVIRAAGDINVHGSINDGFAPPPATPDDKGWYLTEARWSSRGLTPFASDIVIPIDGVVLEAGTLFPQGATLNYDLHADALTLPSGTVLPVDVTLVNPYTLRAGTVLAANIYNADNSIAWAAGTVLSADVTLSSNMKLGAGTALRGGADVAALVWPKGYKLPVDMSASMAIQLARGALIPAMTKLELLDDKPINLRPEVAGVQGRNWALAPMLDKGTSSWSMQLTAGADMASADRRAINPASKGSIILADIHAMTRVETKLGGTGYIWGADADIYGYVPGTPVDFLEYNDGYCTFVTCEIDPARISYTWTAEAVNSGFEEGAPVDQFYIDLGICSFAPELCAATINPVKDITVHTVLSPMFSVLRTGTGDINMAAAGDFRMQSAYGVYTAGTRSAAVLDSNGVDLYNQQRGQHINGSLIGAQTNDYNAALASYQAWYPEHGGNLNITAGGDVTGDVWGATSLPDRVNTASAGVGNWLWRQGTGSTATGADGIPTAWWINFGAYALPLGVALPADYKEPYLLGFTGFGTLGGGNLSIEAGGDAGVTERRGTVVSATNYPRSKALVAAVGSTGRVTEDGKLILTGGGDMRIRTGGAINPDFDSTQFGLGGANVQNHDINGALINLRGNTSVVAAAIGDVKLRYRQLQAQMAGYDGDAADVRTIDPFTPTIAASGGGITLVPGDSTFYLDTMRDLVMATATDPGRVFVPNTTQYTANGIHYAGGGQSWFSLWTPHSAINLFAAGGNLTPGTDVPNKGSNLGNAGVGDGVITYPSILRATAASGSLYYGYSVATASASAGTDKYLVLAPSATGALEFLATNSIYGGGYPIMMSGSDAPLPTPFNPAFAGFDEVGRFKISNLNVNGSVPTDSLVGVHSFPLFAFGPDTVGASALHAGDTSAALFYAVNGDVIGVNSGMQQRMSGIERTIATWNRAATAVRIQAGRDVVNTNSLFVHNNDNDISLVHAGRDILYANIQVAGPGTLELMAGRNLTQDAKASVVSIGGLVQGDTRPGADIAMMAGAGINGPDFSAITKLYLNPANLADPGTSLASQPGKVAKTYETELVTWLKDRYGFSGTASDALTYFNALAPEHQRVFLRTVYYAELREGGREYNNPDSRRFGSFLRSRDMIATLFPDQDANGDTIVRNGDITMFGNAGVHTNFGGNIQMMAPGGQIVVGVQGEVPAATAGVVTQGKGDIQIFSEQSLLLGLSRVMTTFGGDIFAWSEQGDINAGRGSKTTVLYTPPKRVYDQWGNVTLSPQVPSSGAGIATLSPVPEAASGNVDLIAPLGTIDAGEAGIRVSGNVNIFALQVVNAANIKVAGEKTGIPVMAAVNVGALTNASAAANSAAAAAQDVMARDRSEARKNLPSIFTVRVLGFGNDAVDDGGAGQQAPAAGGAQRGAAYDKGSAFQVLGQGDLDPAQLARLTEAEQRRLKK